ncbi:MAG: hypothetical protein ACLPKW_22450 [Acetobacteraceae bacterium]|jgi:hypothetical protein
MIDNVAQVERLVTKLNAALPLTPELLATLQARNPSGKLTPICAITWISYAGDEGGIMCRLDLGRETDAEAFASITHLRFDARLPLARDIAAYQRHRVKRLRRQPA